MSSRLVLGCGSVGRRLAVTDGAESVLVVTTDEHRVETLRAEGVTAKHESPSDPEVLRELDAPETIVIGGDNPESNRAAARIARDVFPDAYMLAFAGRTPSDEDVADLEELADEVIDPRSTIATFLMERIGDEGIRTRRLRRIIRSVEGRLAVVTHDNPDPDAIASAVALAHIAEQAGTPADVCYFGNINHQENRALVNVLGFDLTNLDPDDDLSDYDGIALVDHSRPGVNDQLPPDTDIDIVIDHHPPRAPVEARFVDLRSDVGATSTLLVGYLTKLGLEPPSPVATALLFGIHIDTQDFSREVSIEDFEAAAYLTSFVDVATLELIESPSVSFETYDTMAAAIRARELRDSILLSYVGKIGDRDALAQAADQLLGMEGVNACLVYGSDEETIYASARARGIELDIGEALREAFGQIGSAGGHADMAGAQIPVGTLVEAGEPNPHDQIREVIADRFFETLGVSPNRAAAAVYASDHYIGTPDGGRTDAEEADGDS